MKDLDKILAAAKKQMPPEFPFSDEELSGILSKANKTKITDYSKSKTISKGVKAMTISGITFSLVLGICMLFSTNSNTDKMGDEQYSTLAKATNVAAEANAPAQMQINSQTSKNTKVSASQTIALADSQKTEEGNFLYDADDDDEVKKEDYLNSIYGGPPLKTDTNYFEVKDNVLHIYIHKKNRANTQIEALMLNSEEMEKLNIFQTECGLSVLDLRHHDLSRNDNYFDKDSILNAGYGVQGYHFELLNIIDGFTRRGDLVKLGDMKLNDNVGIFPENWTIIRRDVEKDITLPSSFENYYVTIGFKKDEDWPYFRGKAPKQWDAIKALTETDGKAFAKLKKIIYHFDSTDRHANNFAKFRVPIFIRAKADSKEEYYLLFSYNRTSNLKKLLPARYANMETYDDVFKRYDANYDVDKLHSHIKSELANAKNTCNKERSDNDFDDKDKEVLEPFGGMRYLDMTQSELESLGVYINPNESYIYYTKVNPSRFLTTKTKQEYAKYGYDTNQKVITTLYKYKIASFNERFSTKEEIIDNAIKAMAPLTDSYDKINNFDLQLFFLDVDSAKIAEEVPGYAPKVDSIFMQKHSPELIEYIKKNKYNINTKGYVFKYLENRFSTNTFEDSDDYENKGYGLQNASELGKYVVASENNLLITLRRDQNVSTRKLSTPHSNMFWTKDDIIEKYDGLSFYVSISDSSESLVTNRKNLAPVRYNVNRVLASGDTLQIATIAYFYITHDFVSRLPERFRADLYKELDIMGRITRGELLEDQVCHEIEKKDSYFGLCPSDMDLFKKIEGWVTNGNGGNMLSVKFILNEPTFMSIKIYNLQGKLIHEQPEKEYDTYGNEYDHYSPNIVPGVYVMHFVARDGRKYVKKFVVK